MISLPAIGAALAGTARSGGCPGVETAILAGVPDGFALPTEPTHQSPQYADFLTNVWVMQGDRVFDQTGTDLALGHSFVGWMGEVCGATLEFRVRADGSSLADNDSFRLGLTGSSVPAEAFVYWSTLRSLNGGSWPPGSEATFHFDLADLPPRADFPTNVLPELQDGELEFMLEDDSSVDYALLRVCQCPVQVEAGSWGRVKAAYR